MDMFRGRPQPLLVRIDGSLQNIKDTDVLVSASNQVVDESGLATADVDYGRGVLGRFTFYDCKGGFKVQTEPADRVRGLLAINILPMALCIHSVSVDRLSIIIRQPQRAAVKVIRAMSSKSGRPLRIGWNTARARGECFGRISQRRACHNAV